MGAVVGAAAAAMIHATKASGVIVKVEPSDFSTLIAKLTAPLIVVSKAGLFGGSFAYLTSYKGLAFYTKSDEALSLPTTAEIVAARQIWIP